MTRKLLSAALLVAALLALPAAVSAYSNELSVELTEEINVNAESDGAYTWHYNATGGNYTFRIVNEPGNAPTGSDDTRLFDIWVPLYGGGNNLLNGASCTLTTNDTNLNANRCAMQACTVNDNVSVGIFGAICWCLDFPDGGELTDGTVIGVNASKSAPLYFNPDMNDTTHADSVIHITELQGNTYLQLSCLPTALNLEAMDTYPVTFSESFSPRKIVNGACTPVEVVLNVTSNTTCELSVMVEKVLSDNAVGTWSNLTFINGTGNWDAVSTDLKSANFSASFPAGGHTETFYFTVLACPNMTGNTSKLEMGRAYVNYTNTDPTCPNSSFWNISVGHVTAVGPGELNVTKEHYINSNPPNWAENSTFYDSTLDLNYTIYRFHLWAVNGTDPTTVNPNDIPLLGSDYNCTGLPAGLAAGGTFQCDGKTFNSNDIPVVFGKPVFELVEGGISGWDDYYAFENSKNASLPLGSDYFLIENMWVINGYLVRASKTVTPYAGEPGCYNVTIEVRNLGATCTPYLYVYDIVPEEFYSMTGSAISNLTSPWNILVSNTGLEANIAKPGNAQPLLPSGLYDLAGAWLLAFAVPPSVAENWTYNNYTGTFNDSQYTGKSEGLTGTYAGTGYRWELFPMTGTGGAGDDECDAGLYTNLDVEASDVVYITYALCADSANMTYYPSELFIVGIDPINAEGAAAPLASVGFGSGEKSGEPLLMVFLAVLAVIAAALFVKRRRD